MREVVTCSDESGKKVGIKGESRNGDMRQEQSTICIDEPDAIKYHLGSHLALESNPGIQRVFQLPQISKGCIKPHSMHSSAIQLVSNMAFNTVP